MVGVGKQGWWGRWWGGVWPSNKHVHFPSMTTVTNAHVPFALLFVPCFVVVVIVVMAAALVVVEVAVVVVVVVVVVSLFVFSCYYCC